MLQPNHIQHYPIGGENALRVQYTGIINGKELSSFNKAFNESLEGNSRLLIDRPNEVFGLKIGKIRRIEYWNKWTKIWVGNRVLKSVAFDQIKPLLRPMSDLYKERNGTIDIVELAKIAFKESDQYINHGVWTLWEKIATNRSTGICFEYTEGSFQSYLGGLGDDISIPNQLALFQYLFENHYDVFGLIEKGLAIDLNTVEI